MLRGIVNVAEEAKYDDCYLRWLSEIAVFVSDNMTHMTRYRIFERAVRVVMFWIPLSSAVMEPTLNQT